jgi:hypothetical protein
MKLFMRDFYDKKKEINLQMKYKLLCIGCAKLIGGTIIQGKQSAFHYGLCDYCNQEKAVTEPINFIWDK